MNNFLIVGRFKSFKEAPEYGKDAIMVSVTCPRSYKNEDGIYETDTFDIILRGNIATNTLDYCKKGDIAGFKGSLQSLIYEENGQKYRRTLLIADRISFLSSKSRPDEEVDSDVDSEE